VRPMRTSVPSSSRRQYREGGVLPDVLTGREKLAENSIKGRLARKRHKEDWEKAARPRELKEKKRGGGEKGEGGMGKVK